MPEIRFPRKQVHMKKQQEWFQRTGDGNTGTLNWAQCRESMATETVHWLSFLFTSHWREGIKCFDNGSQHFCDKNKFNFHKQWMSPFKTLLFCDDSQYLVIVPSLFFTQVHSIYLKSCLTLLFSAYKPLPQLSSALLVLPYHSLSSWPCPFLPVYPPHSLVPICSLSLTSLQENLPHDPVSAFSCPAQPLKSLVVPCLS